MSERERPGRRPQDERNDKSSPGPTSSGRGQLTDRLFSTALLYATDEHVDVETGAFRLVELAEGDRAALDRAHGRAVACAGDDPRDPVNRRALNITRRAIERGGAC